MVRNNEINVLRYDKVVKAFTDDPSASPEVVAQRTAVALSTVRKISGWHYHAPSDGGAGPTESLVVALNADACARPGHAFCVKCEGGVKQKTDPMSISSTAGGRTE